MRSSPNERIMGENLKKIAKGDSNPEGGVFNHNTNYRDHYKNRFNKVCPITIENYERTYKYPRNKISELDLSVNL